MQKYVIVGLALLVLGGAWWYWSENSAGVLKVDARDTIQSWDFQGSHNDDGANEERARTEIARLEGGLRDAETEPTDYILYVSIANQYSLLGDGEAAYDALNKALAIDSEGTGLAWHNMGVLLEQLGAYHTARVAFSRAVDAQPHIDMYHVAYLSFLVSHFSEDKALVESAFARSKEQFGDATPTVPVMAEWLRAQGRDDEAEVLRKKMEAAMTDGVPESSIITE